MPNPKKPKDLFDLFCDFTMGQAQMQICLQFTLAVAIYLLFLALWHMIRPEVGQQNDYILLADQIEMSSRPLWIPPTLQSAAIENGADLTNFERLSLLEPKLAENLMGAFRTEPWVREVNSVRLKYPAKVFIDAQFREPVAFVETLSSVKDGVSSRATYQVDADGVLLPTDFLAAAVSTNPESIHDYIWFEGIRSTPIGMYGQPWGDPILDEAALLADFLRGSFKQLGLARILLPDESEQKKTPPEKRSLQRIWRLKTVNGREIIWGTFPMSAVIRARSGARNDYETAKQEAFRKEEPKLKRLIDLAKGGSLDALDENSFPIDLTETE